MGKATRWLRGLFGMKKKDGENAGKDCGEKEKKRWSIGRSGRDRGGGNAPAADASWMGVGPNVSETRMEQQKHAIAVAAATAAAADAAVAAARAAVAVIRLSSRGRGALFSGAGDGVEIRAATKIQTVFRGFLARKALRALRGVVKLQALVRGYLVRKRAAATLHSMQALIRAQAAVRARRSLNTDYRSHPELIRARKSTERFDEPRIEFHSKRLSSAAYEYPSPYRFDDSPKIVEIDTGKPRSRSRRMKSALPDQSYNYADDPHYVPISSPLPCPIPSTLSTPDCQLHVQEFDWSHIVAGSYKFATAQSTPRFSFPSRADHHHASTPAKSVCGDSFVGPYSHYPNYMSNTQSFKAKQRSQSAPKQRPDSGPKRRFSLNEMMASRSSFSAVRMQRPFPQVHEDLEF